MLKGKIPTTRAIGDEDLKSMWFGRYITHLPEINVTKVPPNSLIIMGSSGVWDLVNGEKLSSFLGRDHRAVVQLLVEGIYRENVPETETLDQFWKSQSKYSIMDWIRTRKQVVGDLTVIAIRP